MYNRRPRVIPVLLLSKGGIVKTVKFKKPTYLGDPINAVKIFNEKEVDELCLLDIDATREGRDPNYDWLKDIASEAFMPLSYGGGISSIEQIRSLFKIGFEKVILNTSFIKKPEMITEAASISGSQSIVVSIDVKKNILGKYSVYTECGEERIGIDPIDAAKMAERLGAGEIILNSIDNDGLMKGYDYKLIKSVVDSVNIPVIALGGAGSLHDLEQALNEARAHAVAAGSLFVYFGPKKAVLINYPSEDDLAANNIYR